MDYFQDAFGGFDPQHDEDAALKLILDVLAADHRLAELAEVMVPRSGIDGLEGEPGWLLKRFDLAEKDPTFRASVDATAYYLKHPMFEFNGETFATYVHSIVAAYRARNPSITLP